MQIGLHQRLERTKVGREICCRRLAHVADAEREQEACERGVLGSLDGAQEIIGTLLAHTVKLRE